MRQVLRSASGTQLSSMCLSVADMIKINLGAESVQDSIIKINDRNDVDNAMRIIFYLSVAYLTTLSTAQMA